MATEERLPTIGGEETVWCEGCRKLKKEVNRLQEEHTINYQTLKQKIISTDLLIRKYRTKCEEYDVQTKRMEEQSRRLDRTQLDCEMLDTQLKASLQSTEPLRQARLDLEAQLKVKDTEIQNLKNSLEGAEMIQRQYEALIAENERLCNEEDRKQIVKKIQSLESSNIRYSNNLKTTKEELKTLKIEISRSSKNYKLLDTKYKRSLTRLDKYWCILKENDLLPSGDRRPHRPHDGSASDASESEAGQDSDGSVDNGRKVRSPSFDLNLDLQNGNDEENMDNMDTEDKDIGNIDENQNKDLIESDSDCGDFVDMDLPSMKYFFTFSPISAPVSPLPPSPAPRKTLKPSRAIPADTEDTEDSVDIMATSLQCQLLDNNSSSKTLRRSPRLKEKVDGSIFSSEDEQEVKIKRTPKKTFKKGVDKGNIKPSPKLQNKLSFAAEAETEDDDSLPDQCGPAHSNNRAYLDRKGSLPFVVQHLFEDVQRRDSYLENEDFENDLETSKCVDIDISDSDQVSAKNSDQGNLKDSPNVTDVLPISPRSAKMEIEENTCRITRSMSQPESNVKDGKFNLPVSPRPKCSVQEETFLTPPPPRLSRSQAVSLRSEDEDSGKESRRKRTVSLPSDLTVVENLRRSPRSCVQTPSISSPSHGKSKPENKTLPVRILRSRSIEPSIENPQKMEISVTKSRKETKEVSNEQQENKTFGFDTTETKSDDNTMSDDANSEPPEKKGRRLVTSRKTRSNTAGSADSSESDIFVEKQNSPELDMQEKSVGNIPVSTKIVAKTKNVGSRCIGARKATIKQNEIISKPSISETYMSSDSESNSSSRDKTKKKKTVVQKSQAKKKELSSESDSDPEVTQTSKKSSCEQSPRKPVSSTESETPAPGGSSSHLSSSEAEPEEKQVAAGKKRVHKTRCSTKESVLLSSDMEQQEEVFVQKKRLAIQRKTFAGVRKRNARTVSDGSKLISQKEFKSKEFISTESDSEDQEDKMPESQPASSNMPRIQMSPNVNLDITFTQGPSQAYPAYKTKRLRGGRGRRNAGRSGPSTCKDHKLHSSTYPNLKESFVKMDAIQPELISQILNNSPSKKEPDEETGQECVASAMSPDKSESDIGKSSGSTPSKASPKTHKTREKFRPLETEKSFVDIILERRRITRSISDGSSLETKKSDSENSDSTANQKNINISKRTEKFVEKLKSSAERIRSETTSLKRNMNLQVKKDKSKVLSSASEIEGGEVERSESSVPNTESDLQTSDMDTIQVVVYQEDFQASASESVLSSPKSGEETITTPSLIKNSNLNNQLVGSDKQSEEELLKSQNLDSIAEGTNVCDSRSVASKPLMVESSNKSAIESDTVDLGSEPSQLLEKQNFSANQNSQDFSFSMCKSSLKLCGNTAIKEGDHLVQNSHNIISDNESDIEEPQSDKQKVCFDTVSDKSKNCQTKTEAKERRKNLKETANVEVTQTGDEQCDEMGMKGVSYNSSEKSLVSEDAKSTGVFTDGQSNSVTDVDNTVVDNSDVDYTAESDRQGDPTKHGHSQNRTEAKEQTSKTFYPTSKLAAECVGGHQGEDVIGQETAEQATFSTMRKFRNDETLEDNNKSELIQSETCSVHSQETEMYSESKVEEVCLSEEASERIGEEREVDEKEDVREEDDSKQREEVDPTEEQDSTCQISARCKKRVTIKRQMSFDQDESSSTVDKDMPTVKEKKSRNDLRKRRKSFLKGRKSVSDDEDEDLREEEASSSKHNDIGVQKLITVEDTCRDVSTEGAGTEELDEDLDVDSDDSAKKKKVETQCSFGFSVNASTSEASQPSENISLLDSLNLIPEVEEGEEEPEEDPDSKSIMSELGSLDPDRATSPEIFSITQNSCFTSISALIRDEMSMRTSTSSPLPPSPMHFFRINAPVSPLPSSPAPPGTRGSPSRLPKKSKQKLKKVDKQSASKELADITPLDEAISSISGPQKRIARVAKNQSDLPNFGANLPTTTLKPTAVYSRKNSTEDPADQPGGSAVSLAKQQLAKRQLSLQEKEKKTSRKRKSSEGEALPTKKQVVLSPRSAIGAQSDLSRDLSKYIHDSENGKIDNLLHKWFSGQDVLSVTLEIFRESVKVLQTSTVDQLPLLEKLCDSESESREKEDVFMTDTEIRLLDLLMAVIQKHKECPRQQLLELIWHSIFLSPTSSSGRLALCRMFTALCRYEGDMEQVRVLVYKLLTCGYLDYVQPIMAVVSVWPLTLTPGADPSPMLLVVRHIVLNCCQSETADPALRKLGPCFKVLCEWSPLNETPAQLLTMIVEKLKVYTTTGETNERLFETTKSIELLLWSHGWKFIYMSFVNKHLGSACDAWKAKGDNSSVNPKYIACLIRIFGNIYQLPRFTQKHKEFTKTLKRCLIPILEKPTAHTNLTTSCAEVLKELSPLHPLFIDNILSEWHKKRRLDIPANKDGLN